MKDNEALKYLKEANRKNDMLCVLPNSDIGKCLINALEEIQQYREIGTVEKIKEELDRLRNDNECQGLYFTFEERQDLARQHKELEAYRSIGTVEECRAAMEKQKEMITYCDENDCSDCPFHNTSKKYNKCMNDFIAEEIVKAVELMSRVLPILFNTDMVRAILDDLKGATRRAVKGFIPDDAIWGYTAFTPKGYISCRGTFADGYGEKFFKLPCEPGDILYVRETFDYLEGWIIGDPGIDGKYFYRADGDLRPVSWRGKWHPSLHMPKEAARIWLKVKDVRVERLQEITVKGIEKEGVYLKKPYTAYEMQRVFKALWDSTIKKSDIDRYGWDASPWVWVIEFGLCDKPSEPYQQNGE